MLSVIGYLQQRKEIKLIAYYALPDNTKLYYESVGQGQPILFVHGCSCTHRDYDEYVEALKNEYRCIRIDWRGHGASSAPAIGNTPEQIGRDLKDFIEGMNLENVILFVHSYGGFMTYEYAKQFGTKHLAKIIINDEAPKIMNDDEWKYGSDYFNQEVNADMLSMLPANPYMFLFKFYQQFEPELANIPDHLGAAIFQGTSNIDPVALMGLQICYLDTRRDYRDVLPKIDVPFAYVQPSQPLYQQGTAQWVADHVQNGKAILLENCHHLNMLSAVQERCQEVLAFIRA